MTATFRTNHIIATSVDGFNVEQCHSLPQCIEAFRWAQQENVGHHSCKRFFFDVGSHIGVHTRFLFEPHLYDHQDHIYSRVLNEVFGERKEDDEKTDICVIGFEPNPRHVQRLRDLTFAYLLRGWKAKFIFAAAGAPSSGTSVATFYKQDRGVNLDWVLLTNFFFSRFATRP